MLKEQALLKRFKTVFELPQAAVLAEMITEAYTDLVNTSDFNELKAIVKDLAGAQKRTEQRMEELAESQKELADAQKRTEQRMEELADAQKRTEQCMEELAESQKELADVQKSFAGALQETRQEVGGLSRSMSYALENEAYRLLPELLKTRYALEVTERLVRTEISGEEINFFGKAVYQGETVLIVGETKLRLDERRQSRQAEQLVLDTLQQKIAAVRAAYPQAKLMPLLVTHYARPAFVQKAQEQGVMLVQSFEW